MPHGNAQLSTAGGQFDSDKLNKRRDDIAASVRKHFSRLNAVAIGSVRSPSRRSRCRKILRRFCLTYGKPAFPLPFSADHDKAIERLQEAVTTGGRFALAMPRGSGKTTLIIWAILWCLCYGWRRYVVLIACDLDAGKQILDAVKAQLDSNTKLWEDFPELCAPVRAVAGIAQRAALLHANNEPLHMVWSSKRIVCPTTPKAACSGVKVEAYGLDGRLRGAFSQKSGGEIERPDLAVLDDPQKEKHAASKREVDRRERVIKGTVLGMAGPGRRIAAVCPCTVIQKDDLADRLLSAERNPEWQAIKTRLVYSWPDSQDTLWTQYAQIRREAQVRGDAAARDATAFYRANRAAMDAGGEVGWKHRKQEGELSAIQHAENLLLSMGEAAFDAEMNNDPKSTLMSPYVLTDRHVLGALNGLPPRVCQDRTSFVVGFIDINRYGLHWAVASVRMDRSIGIMDYGKFPPGTKKLYANDGTDDGTEEQVVRRGLDTLGEAMAVGRRYLLNGTDQPRRFDLLLVDCGYLDKPVFDFCQYCRLPVRVLASRGFGARNYRPSAKHGRVGQKWHESDLAGKGRFIAHDADWWRAESQKSWLQPVGAGGSVSLFVPPRQGSHAEFSEQVTREKLLGIEPRGTYDQYIWDEQGHEWHDLGDCVTGIHVAASYLGADVLTGGRRWSSRRQSAPRRVSKVKPE